MHRPLTINTFCLSRLVHGHQYIILFGFARDATVLLPVSCDENNAHSWPVQASVDSMHDACQLACQVTY